MSVLIRIHVLIDPALVADPDRIADLVQKCSDFSPIMESAGSVIEEGIRQWFTSQGEGTWAELAASTVRDRFRKGYGPNSELVRTGALLEALAGHDGVGHKFLVSPTGVTVGAYGDALVYMNRLANGDPAHNLPARMLVNVPEERVQDVVSLILGWLGAGPGVQVWADAPLPLID